MVERGQVTGIAEPGGERPGRERGCLFRLLHMQRHGIDQFDRVANGRKPAGVCAGAASDIEESGGRRWQHTTQDLLRTFELHPPPRTAEQPAAFVGDA